MHTLRSALMLAFAALAAAVPVHAQVPNLVNYQGRVAVGDVNFDGNGQFKFALVNANGSVTYWSNNGTSVAGSQPTASIGRTVTKGLYSVLLGDTSIVSMMAIPASVWTNPDVRLRIWFKDGTNGFQHLMPDQRLAPSGYLPDNSVTSTAIASGAITTTKIASGAVGSSQIATGAVQSGNIAAGAIGSIQLASGIGVWAASGANLFHTGGSIGIGTSTPLDALLDLEGDLRLNENDLFLGSGTEQRHGLGFRQTVGGAGVVDGPFLYGKIGGALGTSDPETYSLVWNNAGTVYVRTDFNLGNNVYFGNRTRQMLNLWGEEYGIGIQAATFYSRSPGDFVWFRDGTHAEGSSDPGPGGTLTMKLDSSGNLEPKGAVKATGGLVIESRTNDPEPPDLVTGRIWLRTDL